MTKCIIDNCEEEAVARGLCSKHYKQLTRKGFVNKVEFQTGCKICGPDAKHHSHGFCKKHYMQYKRGRIDINGNLLAIEPNPNDKRFKGNKGNA